MSRPAVQDARGYFVRDTSGYRHHRLPPLTVSRHRVPPHACGRLTGFTFSARPEHGYQYEGARPGDLVDMDL
ncbi:hypothetical protein ACFRJ8_00945 [Arthrobacter sp. NPDC056886]|uniref:hypothetical protein n=1 Tax=Arthrobacter sp. NPDC056886 TaxID=3345960 RepID=UPI00366D908E